MHCTISTLDKTTRYKYNTLDGKYFFAFSVSETGLIYIEIKMYVPFEYLVAGLNEVTNILIKKCIIPKINISNSKEFLKILAKKCGYRKIPSRGISFSVWTHPIN